MLWGSPAQASWPHGRLLQRLSRHGGGTGLAHRYLGTETPKVSFQKSPGTWGSPFCITQETPHRHPMPFSLFILELHVVNAHVYVCMCV